jgi:lactoylglutathione lyase
MKSLKLDHLNITVSSLERSKKFYEELFGLSVREEGVRQTGEPWCILSNGNFSLCLFEDGNRKNPEGNEEFLRVNHFAIQMERNEFIELENRIKDLNVESFYGSPVNYPHSTSIYIKDPSGFGIELVCWKDGIRF